MRETGRQTNRDREGYRGRETVREKETERKRERQRKRQSEERERDRENNERTTIDKCTNRRRRGCDRTDTIIENIMTAYQYKLYI